MRRIVFLTLIIISGITFSSCSPEPLLEPTVTPTPTLIFTPVPSSTPEPGIGVSSQSFQSAFEEIGFTFTTNEDNVQGEFVSSDLQTWVMVHLAGRQENLSRASLNVLTLADREKVAQILNVFFQVAFPVQSDSNDAKDWFANQSGIDTGQSNGETIIGSLQLNWSEDAVAGFSINVAPVSSFPSEFNQTHIVDTFQDNSNEWSVGDVEGVYWVGTRLIENGVLAWDGISQKGMISYIYPEKAALQENLSDLQVSTRIYLLNPAMNGSYGLITRLKEETDTESFYAFVLTSNGSYTFLLYKDSQFTSLLDWKEYSDINVNDWNKLTVQSVGSHFRLFINDNLVSEVDDPTLTGGQNGIIVSIDQEGEKIQIQFDDFEVFLPKNLAATGTPITRKSPTATETPIPETPPTASDTPASKKPPAASEMPAAGDWITTTDFGKLLFTVDPGGAKITRMSYQFDNWKCGPTTNSGTIEISSDWVITDGTFSIDNSLDPGRNQTMNFSGTYDEAGQKFSGTWTEVSFGTNCSGTWEAAASN